MACVCVWCLLAWIFWIGAFFLTYRDAKSSEELEGWNLEFDNKLVRYTARVLPAETIFQQKAKVAVFVFRYLLSCCWYLCIYCCCLSLVLLQAPGSRLVAWYAWQSPNHHRRFEQRRHCLNQAWCLKGRGFHEHSGQGWATYGHFGVSSLPDAVPRQRPHWQLCPNYSEQRQGGNTNGKWKLFVNCHDVGVRALQKKTEVTIYGREPFFCITEVINLFG